MIIGCYTLDLYCDNSAAHASDDWEMQQKFPHQFISERGAGCRNKARKRGWKLNVREGIAICPRCSAVKRQPNGRV